MLHLYRTPTGVVGDGVAFAEVRQADQAPGGGPVGAFVVCGAYDRPMTVRFLDASGELLAEFEEAAGGT